MSGHPRVSETLPEHWQYIAEGGATVVFSYIGPSNLHFSGTVLRLRKIKIIDASKLPAQHTAKRDKEVEDPSVIFHRTVIQRLVPAQLLPRLESVRVQKDWLLQLAQISKLKRPVERQAKDEIDVEGRFAVLATDLVGREGWAVEIKPKWGFLPYSHFLSPSTRLIKTRTCRFCMHAHLKNKLGKDVTSGFCPLDLYSGVDFRVRRALCALWDSWIASSGSINNLRIFVEGNIVRPATDPCSLESLAHRLMPADFTTSPPFISSSMIDLRDRFVAAMSPLILATPVLSTLYDLQRTLDPLDIEGLATLWARSHNGMADPPVLGVGALEPTQEEWSRFVEEYLERTCSASENDRPQPQTSDLRYYCLAYLLSAAFKDCSAMFTMPAMNSGRAGNAGSVRIVDLDVKSITRLAKWEELDREIVDAYADAEPRRLCEEHK